MKIADEYVGQLVKLEPPHQGNDQREYTIGRVIGVLDTERVLLVVANDSGFVLEEYADPLGRLVRVDRRVDQLRAFDDE